MVIDEIEVEHDLLATKWQRLLNVVIDNIAILIIVSLLRLAITLFYHFFDYSSLLLWIMEMNAFEVYLVLSVITVLYYFILETLTGGSIGKFATSTKVVTENGQKPPLISILIRSLARLIPFEAFTFIGTYSIGWHDSLSKTVVADTAKLDMALRLKKHYAQLAK